MIKAVAPARVDPEPVAIMFSLVILFWTARGAPMPTRVKTVRDG